MTDDEHNEEIAKAVRAYSVNKPRIACLERRLGDFARRIQSFVDNPDLSSSYVVDYLDEIRDFPSDPREDAADLKGLRDEQARLKDLFQAHNLEIG